MIVRVRLARDLARAQRRARWACVSSLRGRRVEATVITGDQIRRARELLGWTPYRLAPRAGIGHTLLRQFEKGARPIDAESAARLRAALEEAGVDFLGEGVRLRVCNGATASSTPPEAACSGCFEDAAHPVALPGKAGAVLPRPGFDVTANTGRDQQMKQHHARNRALFPCEFVS